jgi:DDE superfamily endonuclease
MLGYSKLSRSPSIFRSFVGLDLSEFDSVYAEVEEVYSSFEEKRLSRRGRKREIGGGPPVQARSQGQAPPSSHLLQAVRHVYAARVPLRPWSDQRAEGHKDDREPAVREVLPLPAKVYGKKRKLRTIEELEELFPGFKALIDATEQDIPRPKEKRKRKTHYSGKKRRHTVKTQLTVNAKGLIVHRTNHARGRTHDYTLFKHDHPDLPDKVRPVVDLGYLGIVGDYPELRPMIPFRRQGGGTGHKGEKGRKLTPEQTAFNRQLSRNRIVVEHTISRLKKFRVMAHEFRNRLRHYDTMTNIVTGIINLRILRTLDV